MKITGKSFKIYHLFSKVLHHFFPPPEKILLLFHQQMMWLHEGPFSFVYNPMYFLVKGSVCAEGLMALGNGQSSFPR